MRTSNNTILITGGATGIGLALAGLFMKSGNEVIICGRREDRLDEARKKLPGLHAKRCDISSKSDLESLYVWLDANFKELNVLVNNAGIQRRIDLKNTGSDSAIDDEIDINLKAQISLSAHFIPILSKRNEAAIVNISSGLGFVPIAAFPVYCATKAALHSFSVSLRYQLRQTPIKVFEVIPPTVHDTELKGRFLEKNEYSVSASEVAHAVIGGMSSDEYEIAIGSSKNLVAGSKGDLDRAFGRMNH
jgi:uncharacterized oxidoreductase